MATAPSKLRGENGYMDSGYTQTVADSVYGLLYMPNGNTKNLIVAAGAVLCGVPYKTLKVGDVGTLRITGYFQLTASGAIARGGPWCPDTAGKIRAAVVGTDHVYGFNIGPSCTTDGDLISVSKLS